MRNKIHGGSKTKVDEWTCNVKKELFKDAILRTYDVYKTNKKPVVFGQFMFEKRVLEKPSLGKANLDFRKTHQSDISIPKQLSNNKSDGVENIDICEMLHSDRQELDHLLKLSRSECF